MKRELPGIRSIPFGGGVHDRVANDDAIGQSFNKECFAEDVTPFVAEQARDFATLPRAISRHEVQLLVRFGISVLRPFGG
jgi:hypothetical protein